MQNTFSDDTQLWQQLKLGNKNALESIFRNEAEALAKYGKKFTADKELIVKNDISFSVENSWIENEETELRSKELTVAISKLSSRQQEILYLKFHSEMDYDQIIEIMGLNYQSARNLVTRALEALRKSMISIFILIFLFIK